MLLCFVQGADARVFNVSGNFSTVVLPRNANVVDASFCINSSESVSNLTLDVGRDGVVEWGPEILNGTLELNDSNAGLVDAFNAFIPQVDENALGVNYSENVSIELNFSSENVTVSRVNISYVLWFNLCGNVGGNIRLSDGVNDLMTWAWQTGAGNVYAVDSDSSIDWMALRPIGYDLNGNVSSFDLEDISTNLYMSPGYNFTNVYDLNGSVSSFSVFGREVQNVPVVNSSDKEGPLEDADFVTGVLWDSSDDSGDLEYDTTDKEDLVFITNINPDKSSPVCTSPHDYEFVLPANFGSHEGNNDRISLYLELM